MDYTLLSKSDVEYSFHLDKVQFNFNTCARQCKMFLYAFKKFKKNN